jgi:hypothetical protein
MAEEILKVKINPGQSIARQNPSGTVTMFKGGDIMDVGRPTAQRMCWRGQAEPVGWKLPKDPGTSKRAASAAKPPAAPELEGEEE